MKSKDRNTLISYRFERSQEALNAAELLFKNNMLTSSMNRIYYAMFYAVQALLLVTGASFSKHGQVKGYFNKEYIKTGIFPKEFGKLYNEVFDYRQKFDYVDLKVPTEFIVNNYLKKSANFVNKVKDYVNPICATNRSLDE